MIRANLLPPQISKTTFFGISMNKESGIRAVVSVVCSLLIVILTNVFLSMDINRQQSELDAINLRLTGMAARTNIVTQISADVHRLQQIDQDASWLKLSGQRLALRLAYLGNSIPDGTWVDSMHQTPKGWEISGGGKGLEQVSNLARGLAKSSPGLQTAFDEINTQQGYEYKITITHPSPLPVPTPVVRPSVMPSTP